MRFGLRFDRSEAGLLQFLASRVEQGELGGPSGGLKMAADAANTGEPLILQCETVDDAEQMAAQFVLLGVKRPSVEELTGQRPAK